MLLSGSLPRHANLCCDIRVLLQVSRHAALIVLDQHAVLQAARGLCGKVGLARQAMRLKENILEASTPFFRQRLASAARMRRRDMKGDQLSHKQFVLQALCCLCQAAN